MKKNKGLCLLVGLFCLTTSGVSVYAANMEAQNKVGIRFLDSTSTTSSTTSTSTSSTSTSPSTSDSARPSDSLPSTKETKSNGFFFWRDNNGGSGSTTRYYSDDRLLPKTGELLNLALPFAGVFLIMSVFFYLKRDRRKTNE